MKIYRLAWTAIVVLSVFFFQLMSTGCSTAPDKPAVKPDTITGKTRQPQLHKIEISHMAFVPAELKVKKGDKIVFVNEDMVEHDVTEEKNKSWTSSPLKAGAYWTLVVVESSDYFCSLHPVMKGKIIVE